jgi:hypothetical protein
VAGPDATSLIAASAVRTTGSVVITSRAKKVSSGSVEYSRVRCRLRRAMTWLGAGQSRGEAIPIALLTSRARNGQSSTVSALTMVDWER